MLNDRFPGTRMTGVSNTIVLQLLLSESTSQGEGNVPGPMNHAEDADAAFDGLAHNHIVTHVEYVNVIAEVWARRRHEGLRSVKLALLLDLVQESKCGFKAL